MKTLCAITLVALGIAAGAAGHRAYQEYRLQQAGPVLYRVRYDPFYTHVPQSQVDPDMDGWVEIRPAGLPTSRPDPGEPFTSVQP